MRKLVQNLKSGNLKIIDIPLPTVQSKYVLVKSHFSVLSPGTERATIKAGNKSILAKASERPELVKQVLDSVKTEGLVKTYNKVLTKIDKWRGLGYSLSGEIVAVGDGVKDIVVGDFVAAAGSAYANHSEYNIVPMNLTCKVPGGVKMEDAAFATIGSIALQGIRLANPQLGDSCMVIGAGLIGLMAVKLLTANGCVVTCSDLDAGKQAVAISSGAKIFTHKGIENVQGIYDDVTKGRGYDHVFVAAASSSPELINVAGQLCREAGVVTVLGDINIDVNRDIFYEKEVKLNISRSYGPGRYDSNYEERGIDYPFAYVRWSEQRNIESILAMLENNRLSFTDLISKEYAFEQIMNAYTELVDDKSLLGVRIKYNISSTSQFNPPSHKNSNALYKNLGGLIGVGSYATAYLLPFLSKGKAFQISHIVSAGGVSATTYAEKYNIPNIVSSAEEILNNKDIGLVFISSRHSSHAKFVCQALSQHKHVYVDKPICTTRVELEEIKQVISESQGSLFVGTNRRYAKIVTDVKRLISAKSPVFLNMSIHAGPVPKKAWFHDEEEGDGMLISEVVHFIDLATDLAKSGIKSVYARALSINREDIAATDNIAMMLYHDNGGISSIQYMTISGESAPKEIIDINHQGATYIMNNYTELQKYIGKKARTKKYRFDKGQENMVKSFMATYQSENHVQEQSMASIVNNMQAVFAILESIKTGKSVTL